jgi:hypothetical protein
MAPVLPPDVTQFYLSVVGQRPPQAELVYEPRVLGFAEVVFVLDKRKGTEHRAYPRLLAKPPASGHPVLWETAERIEESFGRPEAQARWSSAPDALDTGRKLKALEKAFAEYLYSSLKLPLWQNRALDLLTQPDESRDAFLQRCRAAAREKMEQALAVEAAKFRPRFEALDAQLPEDRPSRVAGAGLSLLKKLTSLGSQPASTKAQQRQEERLRNLTADWEAKKAELAAKWQRAGEDVGDVQIKLRKADVRVTHFGLAWAPFWSSGPGQASAAYR